MESRVESSGHLGIKTERIVEIIKQILTVKNGISGAEIFGEETKKEMSAKQPGLLSSLTTFIETASDQNLLKHRDFFNFGSFLAYAIIPEKQKNTRLTKQELKNFLKNPDVNGLVAMLNEDYTNFMKTIQALREMHDSTNPGTGDIFYQGFMLTLLPFYRRENIKGAKKLDRLFEIDTPSGVDRVRTDK